jgi:uncharacterized protein (TIGR02145 family)
MKTIHSTNPGNPLILRILVQTILAFAITLTLSCSPPEDGGDTSSNSGSAILSSSFVPSSSSVAPSSSSNGVIPCLDAFTVPVNTEGIGSVTCGGEIYKTVKIGDQVWMAKNLNYAASGSKCGNGSAVSDADTPTCDTYGRLYNWATAMALPNCGYGTSCGSKIVHPHKGICPQGWHLPSDAEWTTLINYVDGNKGCTNYGSCAGEHLKAISGWSNCGSSGSGESYVCEDLYGFSALPGGAGGSGFDNAGFAGVWWTATEDGDRATQHAYYRYIWTSSADVMSISGDKDLLRSVRCLKD